MVAGRKRLGKASVVRFAEPPWDETHPRWLVLDQELPVDHLAREVVKAIEQIELLRSAITDDEAGNPLGVVPAWLATTPSTRQIQLERYKHSQERLVELHVINDRQSPSRRRSRDKVVVSTSDPEAALGRDKFHVFRPLYNAQFVTDLNSLLILTYGVFAQSSDAGTFQPMIHKVCSIKGIRLEDMLVDAG